MWHFSHISIVTQALARQFINFLSIDEDARAEKYENVSCTPCPEFKINAHMFRQQENTSSLPTNH